jgi:hypothetical protein
MDLRHREFIPRDDPDIYLLNCNSQTTV